MSEKEYTPEEMFDHLCWVLCSDRERFFPYEESAEKALEDDTLEWTKERAVGYHHGQMVGVDGVIDFIEMYGIDVEGRAKKYVEESDDDIDVPLTRDELRALE